MSTRVYSTALFIGILAGCASTATPPVQTAGSEPVLQSDQQKSSYAQGVGYMQNLQKSEIPLDQDLFLLGMNDVLAKKPLRLDAAEIQKGQDWVFVQSVLFNEKLASANLTKGQAFLDGNKQKPGVTVTASGLQYKVLTPGKSAHKPTVKDVAKLHYRISKLDGTELTSTANQSSAPEVKVGGLIKGWQEAMLLMPEGAKWQLFVPSELAYGEAGAPAGNVEPNETLVYEVELLEILPPSAAKAGPKALIASPTGDIKPTSTWKLPKAEK